MAPANNNTTGSMPVSGTGKRKEPDDGNVFLVYRPPGLPPQQPQPPEKKVRLSDRALRALAAAATQDALGLVPQGHDPDLPLQPFLFANVFFCFAVAVLCCHFMFGNLNEDNAFFFRPVSKKWELVPAALAEVICASAPMPF